MKIAQKIAIFWATQSFLKIAMGIKKEPNWQKLPNLVTLITEDYFHKNIYILKLNYNRN
jgi:hypothetical protein